MFVPNLRYPSQSQFSGQMSDIFDQLFSPQAAPLTRKQAPINLWENEESYQVEVQLPGVEPEQVDLSIEGKILKINAKQTQQSELADAKKHLRERRLDSFERSIELPQEVQSDQIDASLRDGILRLSIAKLEQKQKQRIQIKLNA